MFRAQQNAFDDAVGKATDENLTSENWELILDVCDRANAQESGPREVVAALIKRLAHRNANVQLYTLELANALAQNCGIKVHRELASRSFTDALLRLAGDRTTHQQVKSKILERMQEWTEMFSKDSELGIMEGAYSSLKTQNPNLQPPSQPPKREITDVDRRKEEEELQMALELSVKAQQQTTGASQNDSSSKPAAAVNGSQQQPAQTQAVSSGTTAATVSRVRALFDFQPSEPGELQFKKGDIIAVLESVYKDWWKGSLRGQTGIFPLNYVEKLTDPTQEELARESQMEAEVFGEIKNVEKLLTLLSTSSSDTNVRDNEEITTLYHSTLAIRPKLIELIGKYSQRKDDFTQLNEKFIKARRDYEALLEASMSQPAPGQYGRPAQAGFGYGGGYPPQGPPPQQDPGRFYSPNPQDNRTPQPSYPPQSGPQPFQMAPPQPVPQNNQPPPAQQHQAPYPPSEPGTSSRPPVGSDPYSHRPQSTYDNPQELGTSHYSSPTDPRPQGGYPPAYNPSQSHLQPGGNDYSPSVYSPEDGNQNAPGQPAQPGQQQQQQYTAYPGSVANQAPPGPAGAYPPQPTYGAPKPPSPQPVGSENPYPSVGAGGAAQPQYQAYKPGQTAYGAGGGGGGGGGDASDFYR